MEPIEIRARREALGMSQDDLAKVLGVRQTAVSQWENGTRSPRDPASVDADIANCEDIYDTIVEQIYELGEHKAAVQNSPNIELKTYWNNRDYWTADKQAEERGWLASIHRVATVAAARALLEDYGIVCRIVK